MRVCARRWLKCRRAASAQIADPFIRARASSSPRGAYYVSTYFFVYVMCVWCKMKNKSSYTYNSVHSAHGRALPAAQAQLERA